MTTMCPDCMTTIAGSTALLAIFFGLLVAAAAKDVMTMTIPNGISLALLALYPAFAVVADIDWIDGILAGGAVFAVGIVLFALGWLGGGDVKLLAATSLWAGTPLLLPALFVTAIAGGALCVVVGLRRIVRSSLSRRAAEGAGAGRDARSIDAAPSGRAAVVPYAVAILAGGTFVAIGQLVPVWRLAETAL